MTRPGEGDLIPILFDMELMRPGCAILQVLAGADRAAFGKYFGGSDRWLTYATPGMKVYRGTAEQWAMAARISDAAGRETP